MTRSRILFFGNERLATGVSTATPVLRALVAAGYEVAAVVVAQNQAGKSRQVRQLEIAAAADELGVPLISPAKLSDAGDQLAEFQADIGVLVAFGKIVPTAIIELFPKGIINIHPSLLPKHRGPTPIESAILHGDKETGVSLMKLAAEMDAGPVYAQETVLLKGNETKQQLADQLLVLGKKMLLHNLPDILDEKLKPTEQDDSNATYDEKIDKSVAELDFRAKSAQQLTREVRAFAGWPRSRANIAGHQVIITKAHPAEGTGAAGTLWLEEHQLGVYANSGILVIDSLLPSGKKELSAAAFLAGYKPVL
jgi:methionyl-tRNA formyltransferase